VWERVRVRPIIVVFTGLPGTGKSTLAELTGRRLGAPVFSGDWLLGSMKPAHRQLARLDQAAYHDLYLSVLTSLVTRQLMLDQSGVADCVLADAEIAQWIALAGEYGATLAVIECVCSDEVTHRSRVKGRVRGIPGWHEIDWDHVEHMRSEVGSIRADRLVVDAVVPLESNASQVWEYVTSRKRPPGAA
jgi:predicted kinase